MRTRALSAKAFGVLAVVGMVIAFSLSSTLVKRAESPGVLVAFWRMIAVSVVWNVLLWGTGRWITMRNVRQVFVPGVFFGLNLAVFFAGATHNSVANAALIGSLAPFLIVPVGAWLFKEYIDPRALVFALLAFVRPRDVAGVDRRRTRGRARCLDRLPLPPGPSRGVGRLVGVRFAAAFGEGSVPFASQLVGHDRRMLSGVALMAIAAIAIARVRAGLYTSHSTSEV
jgi:EamA-like transporter family